MPQSWTSRSLYFRDFEKAGEASVRADVASGMATGETLSYAREWLAGLDAEREAARLASQDAAAASQLEAAISAKDAAWAAARAASEQARLAQNANVIATIAIIISLAAIPISAVVAIIAAHLSR